MANNIAQIKSRMQTVSTAQKITTAMKLVSLSKLQKFRRQKDAITPFIDAFRTVPFTVNKVNRPILLLCIVPDLGLASSYLSAIKRFLAENAGHIDQIVWLGTQSYEAMQQNPNFNILNEKVSSEHLVINELYEQVITWKESYHIQLVYPYLKAETLAFSLETIEESLFQSDFIVYEPDFETANQQFQATNLLLSLYLFFYDAKISEYTVRRIAMEQASENAEEMQEDLNQQYNRIRQEKITREITELATEVN